MKNSTTNQYHINQLNLIKKLIEEKRIKEACELISKGSKELSENSRFISPQKDGQ